MNSKLNTADNNCLQQLAKLSTIVADTGDIEAIKQFNPVDATTNPSLITAAAKLEYNLPLIQKTIQRVKQQYASLSQAQQIDLIIDELTVQFGVQILNIIKGRVSTEVDAKLSFDSEATVKKAHSLLEKYQQQGIDKNRVLIKIAATWQGIQAAKTLEAQGIHTNLTLIFGLHQAIACANANVTLISPFVGRILDWYKASQNVDSYAIELDPGVLSVKQIYAYYKQFGIKTEIMGASFRSVEQVLALARCDLLTISPALLQQLSNLQQPFVSQLQLTQHSPVAITNEAQFNEAHGQNAMAVDLLSKGIQGFVKAKEELAALLQQMM